jgi:quercetin dioxygenase-like cupin family protein
MTPHDIRAALARAPELKIGPNTTAAEAEAAFPMLARFEQGGIFAGRFSGQSPWERHATGDELLHVLEGEVDVTVLTADGAVTATVRAGQIFIVPRGLWHRQLPRPSVTLVTATPPHSDISFAENPEAA